MDTSPLLSAIEADLQQVIQSAGGSGLEPLRHMMAYAMGWEGEGAGPAAQGKRLRPLLVLLTTSAAGGKWQNALPAAAAVELLHNFSLVHDDIEDNSPLRRGRPTVWRRWGIPQAINTGDAMFTLAHLALGGLAETIPAGIALQAFNLFQHACLQLTQGQYLDIAYETRPRLDVEDYWPMICGKTAALLQACTGIGAMAAQVDEATFQAYSQFGHCLGLAFQVQDDLLGIWGEVEVTGKSTASDLVTGKKSLPVVYGLSQRKKFARRWQSGPISAEEAPSLALLLEAEGGRSFTEREASRLTGEAMNALERAHAQGETGEVLRSLAQELLTRQK